MVRSASPVWLWPSMRAAAQMLHVNAATLQRRRLPTEQCGQEHRLAPTLVLKLGDHFRRRDVGEIGGALIANAERLPHNEDDLERLEEDVERYLASTRSRRGADVDAEWLAEAKRRLPPDVYGRVLEVFSTGEHIESFRGVQFHDDEEG
jgi:hypothetical protein